MTPSLPAVTFEVSPAVGCGIEVSANGQKLTWTCADTLSSLEQRAAALFDDSLTNDDAPLPGAPTV